MKTNCKSQINSLIIAGLFVAAPVLADNDGASFLFVATPVVADNDSASYHLTPKFLQTHLVETRRAPDSFLSSIDACQRPIGTGHESWCSRI